MNLENKNVSIKDGNLATLSLYDLNKQIISQMPELTNEKIEEKINLIKEFGKARGAEFYMLLNNEIRYYTLFRLVQEYANVYSFEQEVINCLKYLGTIKAIDLNSDGVIEAWVQLHENDEVIVLYLFPYDEGVILCQ